MDGLLEDIEPPVELLQELLNVDALLSKASLSLASTCPGFQYCSNLFSNEDLRDSERGDSLDFDRSCRLCSLSAAKDDRNFDVDWVSDCRLSCWPLSPLDINDNCLVASGCVLAFPEIWSSPTLDRIDGCFR